MAKVRNARADHFHVWRVTAHAPEFRLRMCIFLRMRTGCLVLTSDTTSVVDEVKVFFFPSPVRSLLSCNARWPALLVILGSYRQPPGRPQAQQWQVRMIVGIPESPRDPEKRGESHSHCMCRLGPPRGPVTPKARRTRVSTHLPPLAPLRNVSQTLAPSGLLWGRRPSTILHARHTSGFPRGPLACNYNRWHRVC